MATNFPSSLDNSTTIPVEGAITPLSTNHVTAHQNLQDAVEAIEAKIGADSSAVTTSHDYKLGEVVSTDKAVGKTATQTLTNKTLTAPTVTGATITTSTVNGVTLTTGGSATDFLAGDGTYVAGSVSNASTTAKGIVEAATSAEVTAGTATGATGAVLVVTPDALASSTPVFNGSGLTNISGFLASSGTDVVNDNNASEVTMLTYALAGGTLGTNKGVRIRGGFTFTNGGSTTGCTFRIKYGGTTVATFTENNTNTTTFTGTYIFDCIIFGAGTTSTQETTTQTIAFNASTTCIIAQGDLQTSSIDSTSSQNIVITAQNGGAAVGRTSTLKNYFIQKIV